MTADEYRDLFEKFMRAHNIAVNELTERQAAEALRQAIACGDFARLIRFDGHGQSVIYEPYRQYERLNVIIRELRDILAERGIDDPTTAPSPL